MADRIAVETCPDNIETLRKILEKLSGDGHRIINVIWQPARETKTEVGPYPLPAGYVIISEYDLKR